MAEPQTNLRVRISADLADIKAGLATLRKDLAQVKSQAASSFGNQNAFVNGIRRARTEVAAFAATYLSLRGAGVLSSIADEATLIRARIKEAKGDYEAILALAQETRAGLQDTASLYVRLQQNGGKLFKTQQDLLTVTRAVNQAVKLSYTGAAQGAAGIQQLGQAISSNNFAGDELKSVSENTPRLYQAIADGLGKTRGEVRKLGKDGVLSAEIVLKAIKSQAGVLQAEYAKVPLTIGDAITRIKNAFLDYIGDQDAATGASRRFAETLSQIAKDLPKYLDPVLKAIKLLLENLDLLAVFMATRLAGGAILAAISGFLALRNAILAARAATLTLQGALALLGGPVTIALAALAAGMYYLYQRTNDARKAAEEHTKALQENANLSKISATAARDEANAKRQQALATLKAAQAILEERKARLEASSSRTSRGGDRGDSAALASAAGFDKAQENVEQAQKALDDWTSRLVDLSVEIAFAPFKAVEGASAASGIALDDGKKKIKGVIDTFELAVDAIKRQLEELDRQFAEHEIGVTDYFAKKQRLLLASIDAQVEQAKQEAKAAKSSDEQSRALTQIVKLQRDRAEVVANTAREQTKAEEDIAEALGKVKIRLLELQNLDSRATRATLEEEYKDLLEKLEANADKSGIAIVRKLINVEAARAQLEQFKGATDRVLSGLSTSETSLSAQADAGVMGGLEAERRIDAERTHALVQLRALRDAALEYLKTLSLSSPEAQQTIQYLQELQGKISDVAASQHLMRQQFEDAGESAVGSLFVDLAADIDNAGEAARRFGLNIAQSLAQIAGAALAKRAIQALTSLFTKSDDADANASAQIASAAAAGLAYSAPVNAGAVALGTAGSAVAAAGAIIITGAAALQAAAAALTVANSIGAASVAHGGGVIGETVGRMRRGLPSSLFVAAPRYHSGGIAGLGPNEVPAVLQKGEEVLTRQDPRHRDNVGPGGRDRVTTPIVAFGDDALADALAGTAGEKVVVTHVENNIDRILRSRGM
jgi:tape measure domain-containing protein